MMQNADSAHFGMHQNLSLILQYVPVADVANTSQKWSN